MCLKTLFLCRYNSPSSISIKFFIVKNGHPLLLAKKNPQQLHNKASKQAHEIKTHTTFHLSSRWLTGQFVPNKKPTELNKVKGSANINNWQTVHSSFEFSNRTEKKNTWYAYKLISYVTKRGIECYECSLLVCINQSKNNQRRWINAANL